MLEIVIAALPNRLKPSITFVLDLMRYCHVVGMLPEMQRQGVVNLPRMRRHGGRCDDWSESDRRILGELGEFAPCNEPGSELFAIK
jgi:hypothetical protein